MLVFVGFIKIPDKLRYLLYMLRLGKSFLFAILGYIFFSRLTHHDRLSFIRFFFYCALLTIVLDTIYSLFYFYSLSGQNQNIWVLYSSLKVSYIYADKNMVAFTISLLMILSYRFLNKKYLILLLLITFITLSRSGILVNSILLVYMIGLRFLKVKYLLLLFLAFGVACLIVVALNMQHLFLERLTLNNDQSLEGRLNLQLMGINMWLDAPLFGKGLSGYEQNFMAYYTTGEANPYPHNLYVYVLAEFGLIGFVTLAMVTILVFIQLWPKKLWLAILSYSLFGFFLFNLSEYQFFFLIGIFLAYSNQQLNTIEDSSYTPIVDA